MAERKRGMGRGLAAILPESGAGGPELRELPVEMIEPNPDQPRTNFEKGALDALAGSIKSAGLLQPLIVRPVDGGRYELVAGERRWRAAQKAGLERVPAVIRVSPEDERLQAALIENMVREDLNPVDEARACAALVDDLGISKEELARRVGRSRVVDLEPDPAARPARRGADPAGARRAHRGPRPRPAPGLRPGRPGRASRSGPPPRAGRSARPRTARGPAARASASRRRREAGSAPRSARR